MEPKSDQYEQDLQAARDARAERERHASVTPGALLTGDPRYHYVHPGNVTPEREARLRAKGYSPAPKGDSKAGYPGSRLWRKPMVIAKEDAAIRASVVAAELRRLGGSPGRLEIVY